MNTLELQVKRRYFGEAYTIGTFSIDNTRLCDSLEDKNRDANHDGDLNDPGETKVYGQTCIPFGRYKVIMALSPHFKRRLPLLQNVPGFGGILIHRGNVPDDTLGCILVGENKEKGKVLNSTPYEIKIVEACEAAEEEGKDIYITIV